MIQSLSFCCFSTLVKISLPHEGLDGMAHGSIYSSRSHRAHKVGSGGPADTPITLLFKASKNCEISLCAKPSPCHHKQNDFLVLDALHTAASPAKPKNPVRVSYIDNLKPVATSAHIATLTYIDISRERAERALERLHKASFCSFFGLSFLKKEIT